MLNRKEITSILIVTLILGFVISLVKSLNIFLYTTLAIFLVILVNVIAKKVAAFYLDSEIEMRIWEIERFGYRKHDYLKKPVPAGAFMPLIFTVISFGYTTWLAPLVFEVKPAVSRAARRWGLYNFSEMTEWHIGLIAIWGIVANLVFAIIGYLINFPEFTRLNIYFAAYNLIPLSDLDGNKIFFGDIILWNFLVALTLIGIFFTIFVI